MAARLRLQARQAERSPGVAGARSMHALARQLRMPCQPARSEGACVRRARRAAGGGGGRGVALPGRGAPARRSRLPVPPGRGRRRCRSRRARRAAGPAGQPPAAGALDGRPGLFAPGPAESHIRNMFMHFVTNVTGLATLEARLPAGTGARGVLGAERQGCLPGRANFVLTSPAPPFCRASRSRRTRGCPRAHRGAGRAGARGRGRGAVHAAAGRGA